MRVDGTIANAGAVMQGKKRIQENAENEKMTAR